MSRWLPCHANTFNTFQQVEVCGPSLHTAVTWPRMVVQLRRTLVWLPCATPGTTCSQHKTPLPMPRSSPFATHPTMQRCWTSCEWWSTRVKKANACSTSPLRCVRRTLHPHSRHIPHPHRVDRSSRPTPHATPHGSCAGSASSRWAATWRTSWAATPTW